MKDTTFLNVAWAIAPESKCISMAVGAVLVLDNRIIATGYNGTAPGHINCCDAYARGDFTREEHHQWSQKYETHAELNSILHCPVSTVGATIYVTHSPCFNCVKHIISAGIKRIVFSEKYHRTTDEEWYEIVDFCLQMQVGIEQIHRRVCDGKLRRINYGYEPR